MSDTVDIKTIDRIRKLLNLAQNNTNENEASAAMDKAQSIMAEHNLTMAVLESQGKTAEGGGREKAKVVGRALYQYQRSLMKQVSVANFCFCEVVERTEVQGHRAVKRKGYSLIGRQSNVIATELLFDYLNQTMERLVPITDNKMRLSKSAISWKEGCAARIGQRIDERRYAIMQENKRKADEARATSKHPSSPPPEPGALMLLTELSASEYELNIDFLYGYEPGTTARRRLEREAKARETALVPVEKEAPVPVKPLTAKEQAVDRARSAKWQAKWEREQNAFWARKDMNAFRAGEKVGNTISLDQQITSNPSKKIT